MIVPGSLWSALERDWQAAAALSSPTSKTQPDKPGEPAPPAAGAVTECAECWAEGLHSAAATRDSSALRQAEKAALGTLCSGPTPMREVAVGDAFAMVPAAFMHDWRLWMQVRRGKEVGEEGVWCCPPRDEA